MTANVQKTILGKITLLKRFCFVFTGVILFAGSFLFSWIFLFSGEQALAYHNDWHDCISISAPISGTAGRTSDAGSILFSDDFLKEHGQNGSDDEVFRNPTFVDLYVNNDAFRTCIDTDYRNQSLSSSDFYNWYFYLRGWTYNDNLGWVSFNCTDWDIISGAGDVCGTTATGVSGDVLQDGYKTFIDVFGYLHGYAWSTKVGWIQFDWDISSCGSYTDTAGHCQRDEFYYQQTLDAFGTGRSIPSGRVYDNLTGRDDAYFGANPAGDSSYGGLGRFYGYAWSGTVGWFDFLDGFGVEDSDSFCNPDGNSGTNDRTEGCGEIWRPGQSGAHVRVVNEAREKPYDRSVTNPYGSIIADGFQNYRVEVQFTDITGAVINYDQVDHVFLSATFHDALAPFFLDEENTTEIDQLSPSDTSSAFVRFPDPDTTSVVMKDTFGNGNFDISDDSNGDGKGDWLTVAYIFSYAPTSNMNGVDFNGDGVYDLLNDGYEAFAYRLSGIRIEQADFDGGLLSALPVVQENAYFVDASTFVDLKTKPVVSLLIENNGNSYITTSREQQTPFDFTFSKSMTLSDKNLNGMSIHDFNALLQLSLDGMDFNRYPDDNSAFHFVFDNNSEDGFYSYQNDRYWQNLWAGSTRNDSDGLTSDQWDIWNHFIQENSNVSGKFQMTAVPTLNPSDDSAEFVKNPEIRSSLSYFSEQAGNTVRYKGQTLTQSESVYSPVVDVRSGFVNERNIRNLQEGIDVRSIGDVRTNVARDVLYKNMKSVTTGANITSCSGMPKLRGEGYDITTGGYVFYDNQIYYFKGCDVVFESFNGIPSPYGASPDYKFVGWDTEKTIIVDGGNIFINANLDSEQARSKAVQTGIISFADSNGKGGNVYIHPDVTNVRAIVYADGVIAGYDGYASDYGNEGMTRESDSDISDLNGDGDENDRYLVPTLESMSCPDGLNAPVNSEEVFHNQFLFQGVLTSLQNTLGGADDSSGFPVIGTGEKLRQNSRAKELAKQYDFNYFRFYRWVLERHPDADFPVDQQCVYDGKKPVYYYDSQYYVQNGSVLEKVTDTSKLAATCNGIDSAHRVDEGGDLIERSDAEVVCGLEDGKAFMLLGVEQNYRPFIVIYEALSPTLPVFWASGSDFASQQQVNR